MRDNAIEALFSLFTSPDRAVAIAGDMTEERERRGRIWFWLHVVSITFALWRNVLTHAPVAVLGLAVAGGALLMLPTFVGVAVVMLLPSLISSKVAWLTLALCWWGGALWTGVSLVSVAPKRGTAACAMLAVIYETMVLASASIGIALWRDLMGIQLEGQSVPFFIIGILAAVPLLVGAVVARRRLITWGLRAARYA